MYLVIFHYSVSSWPERQDGDEDGLLVDVPAEHEGAESTENQAAQETPSTTRTTPDGRHGRLHGQTTGKKCQLYKSALDPIIADFSVLDVDLMNL